MRQPFCFVRHGFIFSFSLRTVKVLKLAVKVVMKICTRVAGVVKCKDGGFVAEYEKGTVGPTSVSVSYP